MTLFACVYYCCGLTLKMKPTDGIFRDLGEPKTPCKPQAATGVHGILRLLTASWGLGKKAKERVRFSGSSGHVQIASGRPIFSLDSSVQGSL